MNDQPLVSVIIPNYNHEKYIEARIMSILEQTYSNFELIILDDNSTDGCVGIINKFKSNFKVTNIVINERNSGSTFIQWERGVQLAKGELILVAESDDLADPKLVETLVIPFLHDPNSVLSYSNSMKIDENGRELGNWQYYKAFNYSAFGKKKIFSGVEYINTFLLYQNTIPNASAVIFKKKIYQKVGGVDHTIEKCGDWFLWLKMVLEGNVSYCDLPLNKFRIHTTSVIGSSISKIKAGEFKNFYDLEMRKAFDKYLKETKSQLKDTISLNQKLYRKDLVDDLLFFVKKRKIRNAFLTFQKIIGKN
jgi:glycosyltransferase involved in cell wall biosynthesis